MTTLSKVKIVSNAIELLGHQEITTIASSDKAAQTAASIYDYLLPAILAQDNWRFATTIIELSRSTSTPDVDRWDYIYQLPADYLALHRLYPIVDYQIYENKLLYTNYNNTNSALYAEYRFIPDVTRFPYYFVEYFQYKIAANSALAIAHQPQVEKVMEAKASIAYARALAADAKSHPPESIYSNPYIDIRGS